MKIKFPQIISLSYLVLVFILLKKFYAIPVALFVAALMIDSFTKIRPGIKNLLYVFSALSAFAPLLWLFLLYLPFAAFGTLLTKKSFIRNYIFGFAVSFIPATLMYLSSTYLSLSLNLPIMLVIFYLLPVILFIMLRGKSIEFFEVGAKECASILIILSLVTIVAYSMLDQKNLFMANGVREFARLQNAVQGLGRGEFAPYNPSIAQGEATFLWNAPSFYSHISFSTFITGNENPILSFNYETFFILLLSIISLSVLLASIAGSEEQSFGALDMLAVTIVSLAVGLNFFFLQLLESFKQCYSFPIAYLFLSIILENPKAFREFITLMYLSVVIMLVHIPYGAGVNIIAFCLFLLVKGYYVKDKSELRQFMKWLLCNKIKILIIASIMVLLPLFYIAPSLIYKDFFAQIPKANSTIAGDVVQFFREFFQSNIRILSLHYPDVNRIDDHRSGFLLAAFGSVSFILLILMYKARGIKNFRVFAFGYILNLTVLSFITAKLSVRIGGFYRTVPPYLLILMGASILSFILLFNKKIIKLALITAVALAFAHSIPYAQQNLSNIHREMFASGEVYKSELNFIRQLPVDGRIMTYGLFSNAIDFGGSYLTGRYFSRNERIELAIERTIFEKIHGQHSFGQEDLILPKRGAELYNYLRLGGYKYLFLDARYPTGNHVALQMYPNFSRAIYQNGHLVIFEAINTSYAEKVDLVKNLDESVYKERGGYKYLTLSTHYGFDTRNINFKDAPSEPVPLKFERLSPAKVRIFGNFNDGDFVVFKEQYFTRWKAYMNGIQVPVYASNHDLILVRALGGNEILLEYSVLSAEKIIGISSLAGFLMLASLFLYMANSKIIKIY